MKSHLLLYILAIIPLFTNAQNPVRDTSFSFDGHVRTAVGPNNESATAVAVQPDGKIIAAGTQTDNAVTGPQRFALVRYLNNGDLDSTFGVNGKAINAFQSQNFLITMMLQPDGKILAAGQASSGFCIARYQNNGSLDSTFGANGFTVISSNVTANIGSMQLLPSGKIIASGVRSIPSSSNYQLYLVQFNSNGTLDSTFGTNGIVIPTTGFISASGGVLLVQPDGKYVLGGRYVVNTGPPATYQLYLMRFFDTGAIDSSFGNNGISTYSTSLGINDMAFDANAKIVAVGNVGTNAQGTLGDVVVMRFNSNGITDSTFGTNGNTSVSVTAYAEYANAVVVQGDGKIILGGSYFNLGGGSVTDCMLMRFTDSGARDTSFGVNGVYVAGVSSGTDRILDMALTSDNKIVISGDANYSSDYDFIVGRFITDQTNTGIIYSTAMAPILHIFPNPAQDEITIPVLFPLSGNRVQLNVFDAMGHTVYDETVTTSNVKLSVSNLVAGVYLIQVTNGTSVSRAKFIKQ